MAKEDLYRQLYSHATNCINCRQFNDHDYNSMLASTCAALLLNETVVSLYTYGINTMIDLGLDDRIHAVY